MIDDAVLAELDHVEKFEAVTRSYVIPVTGLYRAQDPRDRLWCKCVRERRSLTNVARDDYHNSLLCMANDGLNVNFMQRCYWFQPQVIVDLLKKESVTPLEFLAKVLGMQNAEFLKLQLSAEEYELMGITGEQLTAYYGKETLNHELERLGHKTDVTTTEEDEHRDLFYASDEDGKIPALQIFF